MRRHDNRKRPVCPRFPSPVSPVSPVSVPGFGPRIPGFASVARDSHLCLGGLVGLTDIDVGLILQTSEDGFFERILQ
jgi:hypothetical protein